MYRIYAKPALVAGAAAAAMLVGSAARAQGAPASNQVGPNQVGEIVVTAQKRSERLLDVPMSVAAISGSEVMAAGITTTSEIQQLTPSVATVHNGLAFTPSIRGISSIGTSAGDETNVAVYLDDVYLGTPITGVFDLLDVERIEVLKGPQGTLFGRNATGGAIRIITRAPQFTPSGQVSADYGFNYKEWKLGAYVTGPITDTLAGSLSIAERHSDGFIKGIGPNVGKRYGKANNPLFRGKLLWKPSDAFQATLSADTWRNSDNSIFVSANRAGVNEFATSDPGSVAATPLHYSGLSQPVATVKGHDVSLDATWNVASGISLRSISAYRKAYGYYQTDQDRTSAPHGSLALAQGQENLSQEFDLNGKTGPVDWLVGAYYYHSLAYNPYFASTATDFPGGVIGANFADKQQTNAAAAFLDVTWNVTDQLHLTGGARYSKETKKYQNWDLTGTRALAYSAAKATYDSPTWRAVVRYDLSRDANVYASYSTGFKSGVFNSYSPLPIPVHPEKIKAWEIGAKARVQGVTLTAAAFDYTYSDIQVQANALFGSVFVVTLTNAAKAKVRGAEFTAQGQLTEHLSFNAGVGWLPTAKYTSYTTAQVFVPTTPGFGVSRTGYDASGSRMIRAPKYTANLQATYTQQVMGGEFAGTLSDSYTSGLYWQAGDLTRTPGYNIVNGRLAWTDPSGRFTYSVWGANLTDKLYSAYTTASTLGEGSTYQPRRQIGVGVSAKR
jgi:iron complex outermembrane receptor protein